MIAAYEAARGALVVKHQSIAAVRADIVERLDRPVLGPRDQHRCLRHLDRLDDVTTRLREPLDPSDAEPGALEDTPLLEFEVGGREIRFGGNRIGAELGIGGEVRYGRAKGRNDLYHHQIPRTHEMGQAMHHLTKIRKEERTV